MDHELKCLKKRKKRKKETKLSEKKRESSGFSAKQFQTTKTAQSIKEKIDKLDLIKIKIFCSAKAHKNMKRNATDWKKIFASTYLTKSSMQKIYKMLKIQCLRKNNKKWAKDMCIYLYIYFTKEDIQMANKHMKRRLTLLTVRKMQIKSIMSYHYTHQNG